MLAMLQSSERPWDGRRREAGGGAACKARPSAPLPAIASCPLQMFLSPASALHFSLETLAIKPSTRTAVATPPTLPAPNRLDRSHARPPAECAELKKDPLPNFEIGVPAPPKKDLRCALLCEALGLPTVNHRPLPLPTPPSLPDQPLPPFSSPWHAPLRSQWQASATRERTQEMSSAGFVAPNHPPLGYVALCVVARDAHADLLEWLKHHLRCPAGCCLPLSKH